MTKANHKLSRFAKRHYEAIAEAMQEAKRYAINDDQHKGIDRSISELADTFARDNGSFDRDRFKRACVPGANVRARSAIGSVRLVRSAIGSC
jgi:hypothetical protein